MQWDIRDPCYASTVVVCAPLQVRKWGNKYFSLVGLYVVKGIKDFFADNALTLMEQSETALKNAKQLSGIDSAIEEVLLAILGETLRKGDSLKPRKTLEEARDSADLALKLKNRSVCLTAQAELSTWIGAHGFLARQRDGVGEVVRWVSSYKDWTIDRLTQDLIDEGWVDRQLPREIDKERWGFATQKTNDILDARSPEEQRRDWWEAMNIVERLEEDCRSDDERYHPLERSRKSRSRLAILSSPRGRQADSEQQLPARASTVPANHNKEHSPSLPDRLLEEFRRLSLKDPASTSISTPSEDFPGPAPSGKLVTIPERPRGRSSASSRASSAGSQPSSSRSKESSTSTKDRKRQ